MTSFLDLCIEHMPNLLIGLRNGLLLAIIALSIGFFLGLFLSLLKAYGPRPIRIVISFIITFIRGTPLLTQLFIIYFREWATFFYY